MWQVHHSRFQHLDLPCYMQPWSSVLMKGGPERLRPYLNAKKAHVFAVASSTKHSMRLSCAQRLVARDCVLPRGSWQGSAACGACGEPHRPCGTASALGRCSQRPGTGPRASWPLHSAVAHPAAPRECLHRVCQTWYAVTSVGCRCSLMEQTHSCTCHRCSAG